MIRPLYRFAVKITGYTACFLKVAREPFSAGNSLRAGYAAMAADKEREAEGREWIEALISG